MQGLTLSNLQIRLLGSIFERGAEAASRALTQWLGRTVHLNISAVDQVDITELAGLLGPEDATVALCAMTFAGQLDGQLLLVFSDTVGLALVDLLLQQSTGTTKEWTELERSAACETANIVGCAYLNALASHLPGTKAGETLIPSPPEFRHEFAASLLEFALMEQASLMDRVLLIKSRFHADQADLDWVLLFVPTPESLQTLARIAP
jgi:chemotaxis protein CheC